MAKGRGFSLVFAVVLFANAFSAPAPLTRRKRNNSDNEIDITEDNDILYGNENAIDSFRALNADDNLISLINSKRLEKREDDDIDDTNESMHVAPSRNGGSNLFSLLNLATSLFPGSSGPGNLIMRNIIREVLSNAQFLQLRRESNGDNEIEIGDTFDLRPPPLQKQEIDEDNDSSADATNESESKSETEEDTKENSAQNTKETETLEDTASEESVENNNSKQDSDSNAASNGNGNDDDSEDDDSDEPPEGGDGQGGGLLGLLGGLSGGEDGESDLGSLLATVGGIVANLSGDGIDINALIASGLGLFVGLLSEGNENPGSILAGYLLTTLETLTGGGANNNGKFFGTFTSKLLKGISAPTNEDGDIQEGGSDSAAFFLSLLMGVFGDMSKASS